MKKLLTLTCLLALAFAARADFYENSLTGTNDSGVQAYLDSWISTNPVPAENITGSFPAPPTVGQGNNPVLTNEPFAYVVSNLFTLVTSNNAVNIASNAAGLNIQSNLTTSLAMSNSMPLNVTYNTGFNTYILGGNKFTNQAAQRQSYWVWYHMVLTNNDTPLVRFTNFTTGEGWSVNEFSGNSFIGTNEGVFYFELSTNDRAQLFTNANTVLLNCGVHGH